MIIIEHIINNTEVDVELVIELSKKKNIIINRTRNKQNPPKVR